jgi:putative salt-induced outer membrane protein YdiY
MRKVYFLSVWIVISVFSIPASADRVHLVNGDRLSGTVVQMVDGVVTVQSELAGNIEIAMANIKSIRTNAPVRLEYADGTVTEQSLSAETELSRIRAVNPPQPEKPRWKGELTAGAVYTSGNTNNESYNFNAKMSKRTEKTRTTLKGDAARRKERNDDGTDTVTEDWWRTSAKYDYFVTRKWYVFGEGRYETDKIADLNRRTVLGSGLGYQWIESEKTQLGTELGLACVQENYENQGTDTSLSASAGYRFNHQFNDTFSFISDLTYSPSTEQVSDYYLTSTHELRAKINDHLFTNFRILFDYDDTPAQDKDSTDVKYLFGIGLTF